MFIQSLYLDEIFFMINASEGTSWESMKMVVCSTTQIFYHRRQDFISPNFIHTWILHSSQFALLVFWILDTSFCSSVMQPDTNLAPFCCCKPNRFVSENMKVLAIGLVLLGCLQSLAAPDFQGKAFVLAYIPLCHIRYNASIYMPGIR